MALVAAMLMARFNRISIMAATGWGTLSVISKPREDPPLIIRERLFRCVSAVPFSNNLSGSRWQVWSRPTVLEFKSRRWRSLTVVCHLLSNAGQCHRIRTRSTFVFLSCVSWRHFDSVFSNALKFLCELFCVCANVKSSKVDRFF